MNTLMSKSQQNEEKVRFSATVAHIQGQSASRHMGTCFAGKGKICDKTLTPDIKKANRLRFQKHW